MPKFRADFIVRGDLVLPTAAPRQELERSQNFAIFLANAPMDAGGHIPHLIAEVVGDCPDFDGVILQFQNALAQRLDVLSLVTRCKFRIDHCIRILEWEPFKADRKMLAITQHDPYDPPTPDLAGQLISTAARVFENLSDHPELVRPLQCYRYGLLAAQAGEQFQYFWAATENLAETTKKPDPINVSCPQCKGDVFCSKCDAIPTRRKVATEEMRDIFIGLRPADGAAMFKTLYEVRNHLSHGRSPLTVEAKTGISLIAAVENMAEAAWRAIMSRVPSFEGAALRESKGAVPVSGLVMVDITYRVPEGTEQPGEGQIPAINLGINIKFNSGNGEGPPSG